VTVDIARAAVITGDGVVARYPGLLCVARCSDRDVLLKLLDVCAGAAGSDPGRALARRLATWMGGPGAPGDDLEFGTVATAGNQLGVFLVGSVVVVVPGSPVTLSGSDAATFTDRLIPVPGAPVVLSLDGARPPAGLADGVNDLRAGVVPGAGAVLFPVGRAAAPRPDPGTSSALDGPTIRTPAHIGAAHGGGQTAVGQVAVARSSVAPDVAVPDGAPNVAVPDGAPNGAGPNGAGPNGAGPNGAGPNGVVRNRTPRNGVSSLLAEESSDGDGLRDRRSGPRRADPRTPNGYEWFADWSEGGAPPDAGPAPADPTGPDAPAPGSGRWPWSEPPAEDVRPEDTRPAPSEALLARPGPVDDGRPGPVDDGWPGPVDDGRPSRVDEPRPGRADEPRPVDEARPGRGPWTEPPTPPGGSARAARADERAQVWVDPADPVIRDDPADQLQEGRHAIVGVDLTPTDEDEPFLRTDPPAAALPPPVEESEHHEAGPAADRFEGADDATPVDAVDAVAAVEPEPFTDEAPEAPEPQPAPGDRAPDDSAPGDRASDDRFPEDRVPDERAPDVEEAPSPAPRPGRVPTPAPRPQDQTGPGEALPDHDEPLLHGLLCGDGHLNDPRSSACVACGAPVGPGEDVVGPRPPLGRIVFDDGATYTVDAEYLVGRMPEADPRARSGELQPIVVEDRSGSVSRVHAEILINGWDVVLVDSGSRNGTFVAGPDDSGWTPLAPGRTSLLLPGTRVRMGGRTFVFEPPMAVG